MKEPLFVLTTRLSQDQYLWVDFGLHNPMSLGLFVLHTRNLNPRIQTNPHQILMVFSCAATFRGSKSCHPKEIEAHSNPRSMVLSTSIHIFYPSENPSKSKAKPLSNHWFFILMALNRKFSTGSDSPNNSKKSMTGPWQ